MPERTITTLARFPMMILESAEDIGLTRAELLDVMGLSEDQLRDPDGRVPIEALWSFWRFESERLPGQPLGLIWAPHVKVQNWGLVGYTMLYSQNLDDALTRLARYGEIISETMRISLERGPTTTEVVLAPCARAVALRHPLDLRLAVILFATRQVTGVELRPTEVHLPYPTPDETSVYERTFGAPVIFGERDASLTLRNEDLDRPVVQADPGLISYLDRFADEVQKGLANRGSATEQVRRTIWTELSSGHPSLARIARRMGTSTRSLQRRLSEENTTFAELLDELRRTMALRLLDDPNLAIYEIAFLLGYSEPSTFFRAFRRWQGTSPQAYRQKIA